MQQIVHLLFVYLLLTAFEHPQPFTLIKPLILRYVDYFLLYIPSSLIDRLTPV